MSLNQSWIYCRFSKPFLPLALRETTHKLKFIRNFSASNAFGVTQAFLFFISFFESSVKISSNMFLPGHAVLFVCLVPAMFNHEPQKSSYVDSTKTALGGAFFKTPWNSLHSHTFTSTISFIMSYWELMKFSEANTFLHVPCFWSPNHFKLCFQVFNMQIVIL